MLSDLLILDLTNYLPGPYATQLLADLGARVVKIESPRGDPVRHMPPHGADGLSASFRALNNGKRSLAVDLKAPTGKDLLLRLVEHADVLAEGFRPGVMDRLGLGVDVCRARNPRLVYCSITGFGQDGPYRDKAGHDLDYLAYAGALSIGCGADGIPTTPGIQTADLLGSFTALVGILAALHERARTGKGRFVDVSMLDAAVSIQAMHYLNHTAGQQAAPRGMPLNGGIPCYGTYATRDGRAVALGALEPKFWAAFCDITDQDEWLARQFDPDLREEVAALFLTRDREEWRVILENAECCLAPVLDYDEVPQDPQVAARGLFKDQRLAPPLRFEPALDPPAPLLAAGAGDHSAEVLQELLGLEAAEIDALRHDGVI